MMPEDKTLELQKIVSDLEAGEVTRYELCEAISALCRGIALVCERTAIIQPFLNIYKKRAPVLLYAEKFVAQAALKPKAEPCLCRSLRQPCRCHDKKPRRSR